MGRNSYSTLSSVYSNSAPKEYKLKSNKIKDMYTQIKFLPFDSESHNGEDRSIINTLSDNYLKIKEVNQS